jgi:hypothetical protein
MKSLKQFMRCPPIVEGRPRALMATSLVSLGVALALVATPGLAEDQIVPETVTGG